jgi:hypothetical protein
MGRFRGNGIPNHQSNSHSLYLEEAAQSLRRQFEGAFRVDTTVTGLPSNVSSAGQCVVVSVIVRYVLGGELVSAFVCGASHWFNRVSDLALAFDLDLTGDQFGFPPVQIMRAGNLYPRTRVRSADRLDVMTLCRTRLLAERAGFLDAHKAILADLDARSKAQGVVT